MAAQDRPGDVPAFGGGVDWIRRVALAVNWLLSRRSYPFDQLATAPATPAEGRTYYDTVTHKARTWDGTAWQDHW